MRKREMVLFLDKGAYIDKTDSRVIGQVGEKKKPELRNTFVEGQSGLKNAASNFPDDVPQGRFSTLSLSPLIPFDTFSSFCTVHDIPYIHIQLYILLSPLAWFASAEV